MYMVGPDLIMSFAYVKYTAIRGSSQISADLKHLGPLLSICFHLRANLPQESSNESFKICGCNIKFKQLACIKTICRLST